MSQNRASLRFLPPLPLPISTERRPIVFESWELLLFGHSSRISAAARGKADELKPTKFENSMGNKEINELKIELNPLFSKYLLIFLLCFIKKNSYF